MPDKPGEVIGITMKMQTLALVLTLIGATLTLAPPVGAAPPRPRGPCDIYDAAGTPCVAARSTRARCTPHMTARSTGCCASRTARP